jgi:general stress protein 26
MQQAVQEAIELVGRSKFVYLSTLDSEGSPETRVLFNLRKHRAKPIASGPAALSGAFENYLGTNRSSRKAAQALERPRVCLYYSDNAKFQGLTVKGRLEEVRDGAVLDAVYTKGWDMYYPGGKDGGDFILFRFVPDTVSYYHGLSVASIDPESLRVLAKKK